MWLKSNISFIKSQTNPKKETANGLFIATDWFMIHWCTANTDTDVHSVTDGAAGHRYVTVQVSLNSCRRQDSPSCGSSSQELCIYSHLNLYHKDLHDQVFLCMCDFVWARPRMHTYWNYSPCTLTIFPAEAISTTARNRRCEMGGGQAEDSKGMCERDKKRIEKKKQFSSKWRQDH